MKKIKAYSIQDDVWDTPVYDSPKHPHRFRTHESYILTKKEPVRGEKIRAFYNIVISPPANMDMSSDVDVKIPENAFIREIDFEEFQRVFKILGGTVEEEL